MRQLLTLFSLVLMATNIQAQKSEIKIGAGFGQVPYEGSFVLNLELQYDRQIINRGSLFLSGGVNADRFSVSGRSFGGSGETLLYDNSYRYDYSEQIYYLDMGLKYELLQLGKRYSIKGILGASFARSVFFIPDVIIRQGIIVSQENNIYKRSLGMAIVGLEKTFIVNDHLSVNISISHRYNLGSRHPIEQSSSSSTLGGISSFTTKYHGITYIHNITFQVGYRFG